MGLLAFPAEVKKSHKHTETQGQVLSPHCSEWAHYSTCGGTSWRVKGHQRISICPLSSPQYAAMMENSYNHETEI